MKSAVIVDNYVLRHYIIIMVIIMTIVLFFLSHINSFICVVKNINLDCKYCSIKIVLMTDSSKLLLLYFKVFIVIL